MNPRDAGILPTRLEAPEAAVATRDLVRTFGRPQRPWRSAGVTRALDGLNLTVPAGAFYVLVGRNGAGKTTALRVLQDLLLPSQGDVEVLGMKPSTHGARIRAGTGHVPEGRENAYDWMKVKRLLEHHAAYRPDWDWGYARSLGRELELRWDQRWKELSKGQARRVQLVMALAHRPPLLLLDEPTDGLDPVVRDQVLGILTEHVAATEATVLVCTHIVHEAERLADHLGVLESGRLIAQLPRDRLREGLLRYRLVVPEEWSPPEPVARATVRTNGAGRQVAYTLWGDEEHLRRELAASGAEVDEVRPLSLEEATLDIMNAGHDTVPAGGAS